MGRKTRRQALSSRPSVNQRRKSRRQLGFKKKGPLITHATSLGKLEWDKNLTLKQNYEKLGLIADANAAFDADLQAEKYKLLGVEEIYQQVSGIIQSQRAEIEDHRDTKGELHDRLESIKDIPQSNPRLQTTLPLWEQIELRRLIEKHGDDYESMQRDTKLNRYQKTAKQLEKRIKIYHALQNL